MSYKPESARPDSIALLTGQSKNCPYPSGTSLHGEGGKFATDGTLLQWPGNTFICHVDPASTEHDSIRALQEEVKMSKFAHFFNFLPPSSFHMTVFQGVAPDTVSTEQLPTGAVPGMRRDALSALMLESTKAVTFAPRRKAKMLDVFCCRSLTMTGAGTDGETALRKARETLRTCTGINPPNFNNYVFHITLAYPNVLLSEATARLVTEFSAELTDRYTKALEEIPLGPVEFCNFETMHHFEPLVQLV